MWNWSDIDIGTSYCKQGLYMSERVKFKDFLRASKAMYLQIQAEEEL
jgi:hypothetical protein